MTRGLHPALALALAVWFGAIGTLALSQEKPADPATDRTARGIVDAARGVPPEFGADVLLVLAERGMVPDQRRRKQLIEDAYALAGSAQEAVPLRRAIGGGEFTSALNDVFRRGLDRVSLRSRAVRLMLDTDPRRGRELFDGIELPLGTAFSCEDRFSYYLAPYYSAMSKVAGSLSEPAALEQFLQRHLARVRSVAQIEPMVRMLLATKASADELTTVAYALATRLSALDLDSHVLTLEARGAIAAIAQLVSSQSGEAREQLIESSRRWVVLGMNHGLCGQRQAMTIDSDGKTAPVVQVSPQDLYNRQLAVLSHKPSPPLIPASEITKFQTGPAPPLDGASLEWKQFGQMYLLLSHDDAKDTMRWKSEMEKYISSLIDWESDGSAQGDPSLFYLEKTKRLREVLRTRADFVKPSSGVSQGKYTEAQAGAPQAGIMSRDRVSLALADFSDGPAAHVVYQKRRIVWFAPVGALLGSAENTREIDEILTGARNPILALYGKLVMLLAETGHPYN